jgi:large subunit GTPase 1
LSEYKDLDGSTVLATYSKKRGFVTGRGLPDEAKASKIMLKDFVNGKLLYVKLPPEYNGEKLW